MKAVYTSVGTIGDVLPLVALAIEMRKHGHTSLFAVPLEQLAYPRQYGFDAIQVGPDLSAINFQDLRLRAAGQTRTGQYHEALLEASSQIIQELQDACIGADILVSAASMRFSRIVHDLTAIPFASIHYTFPRNYGEKGTRSYEEYTKAEEKISDLSAQLNGIRQNLGLSPLPAGQGHSRSAQLALYAMSRALLPPNEEELKPYQVVGCFFIDDRQWQPDQALETFVQSGEAPVVVSLSSMIHDRPEHLTQVFLEVI